MGSVQHKPNGQGFGYCKLKLKLKTAEQSKVYVCLEVRTRVALDSKPKERLEKVCFHHNSR